MSTKTVSRIVELPLRDVEVLRRLASEIRECAELEVMKQRRRLWLNLNALKSERPLLFVNPEASWAELIPASVLECKDDRLRQWERCLRQKIYQFKYINDDSVIEPYFDIAWTARIGTYGFDMPTTTLDSSGAYTWDPPLKCLERDLKRLHYRSVEIDRETTDEEHSLAEKIFGDVLPPRMRGQYWWTMGLTWEAIKLVGLNNFMLYMYDQPNNLCALMAWLQREHINLIEQFENQGVLCLNNGSDIIGSGGLGYTTELPKTPTQNPKKTQLIDLWGFAESQETVGVSPNMFADFVFRYQYPIMQKFGLVYYGCCEPVDTRIEYILSIPNLRRISVSPWANIEKCAEQIDKKCVLSRKLHPAKICVSFNENLIRDDIRETLAICGQLNLELVMKDLHTIQSEPYRISRWVEIAREEIDKYMG